MLARIAYASLYATQPGFILVNLFSLHPSSRSLSFSLSVSAFLSFFFPRFSYFRLHHTVSFRYILCSDFSLFSNVYTTRVPLFSSYLPCSAHRHSAFTPHTYPCPKDSPRLVPFRTFTFAVAYPMNNPHYGISYDLYTYIREGKKEKEEFILRAVTSSQPTSIRLSFYSFFGFSSVVLRLFTRKLVKGDDETLKHLRLRVHASATLHATRSLGGLDFFLSTPYSTATRLGCQGERARS